MRRYGKVVISFSIAAALGSMAWWVAAQTGAVPAAPGASAQSADPVPVPGMPRIVDRNNLYSETGASNLAGAVAGALERVYVPNRGANSVSVIDTAKLEKITDIKVGELPWGVYIPQ